MLKHLPGTLYSLAQARYADRVIVVIDQDRDDCVTLKQDIVEIAIKQGLVPREHLTIDTLLRVRIAMHELETWFLGDPDAVRAAYPGARLNPRATPPDIDLQPDAWERLERLLQRRGYYQAGIPKVEVAEAIAQHLSLDPNHNTSRSFQLFLRTLREVYRLPTDESSSRSPST